jgi:hypothetical protein
MTTEKLVQSYKELYRKKFDKDLSDEEALDQAMKLITLVKAIYKPITKEDYEKYKRRTT